MGENDSILRQAKDLFNKGQFGEAEALLRDIGDGDPAVLNFRAYLLYRQNRHEEAERAYRSLVAVDDDPSHLVSLGLLRFKLNRITDAKDSFEAALLRRPDDRRALRNLGHCFHRLGDRQRAAECFREAGDEEGSPGKTAGSFTSWMTENASSPQKAQPASVSAGPEILFLHLDEKFHLSSRHLLSYSGVVVFSPTSRDSRRGAARFKDRESLLVRVEGTGELGISGLGGSLQEFSLSEGEHVSVNYPALVLYEDGVAGVPDMGLILPGKFMGVVLQGEGRVVLSLRNPAVLTVADDCPVIVRPAAAVAWTGKLDIQVEPGPAAGGMFGPQGKDRLLRFEGEGHLLVQSP